MLNITLVSTPTTSISKFKTKGVTPHEPIFGHAPGRAPEKLTELLVWNP